MLRSAGVLCIISPARPGRQSPLLTLRQCRYGSASIERKTQESINGSERMARRYQVETGNGTGNHTRPVSAFRVDMSNWSPPRTLFKLALLHALVNQKGQVRLLLFVCDLSLGSRIVVEKKNSLAPSFI